MTPDELLASKLESIRDAIVSSKFAMDALESRNNEIEAELTFFRSRIAELGNSEIRVEMQLTTINKSMDAMSIDIRAVRNSVLSAILGATIIWVAGTVFSTLHGNPRSTLIHNTGVPTSGK